MGSHQMLAHKKYPRMKLKDENGQPPGRVGQNGLFVMMRWNLNMWKKLTPRGNSVLMPILGSPAYVAGWYTPTVNGIKFELSTNTQSWILIFKFDIQISLICRPIRVGYYRIRRTMHCNNTKNALELCYAIWTIPEIPSLMRENRSIAEFPNSENFVLRL